MNLIFRIVLILAIAFVIHSCKKDNQEPEWDYGPFNYNTISYIQTNGSVVVELKQGTSNYMIRKSKGGPQITSAGSMLILNGAGTVTIGVKDPIGILMNGGGLKNSGPISMKSLTISGQSATTILDSMSIDSTLYVQLMNYGDCQIKGKASYLVVSTTNFPKFFGFELVTDSCMVYHTGLSDVQVNVTKKLSGVCNSIGNTFYKGNPPIVNVSQVGSGKFIPY